MINGIDYGPLAQLIGKWVGNKGMDNAPDAHANPDKTGFTDELIFTASGPAENAEEQNLVSVRYHHVVRKLEDGHIFHDQIGHWIYEKSSNMIMHSLTIPRGVCLLAGGEYQEENSASIFNVSATAGSDTFGISQSPFMLKKAKTKAFNMNLVVKGNELNYKEVTSLHIYGKDFEHSDESTLTRVIY
ncbi:MAG: FABP family protein [Gammaproteobacteria bacterium]|nr:FABP family protein [Gammaproteobacteria bacterium]